MLFFPTCKKKGFVLKRILYIYIFQKDILQTQEKKGKKKKMKFHHGLQRDDERSLLLSS